MPLFQGIELEDGRYIGLAAREITALPHVDVFGPDTERMGDIFGGLLEQAEGQLHALVRDLK